jgi:hypothetical protein
MKISQSTELNNLPSTKSATHFIQPIGVSRQTGGLLTKRTLEAINKVNRYVNRTREVIIYLRHHVNVLHMILKF